MRLFGEYSEDIDLPALDKLNSKKDLESKSIRNFGTTENCFNVGWILDDGTMLDFGGRPWGLLSDLRYIDHAEIGSVIEGDEDIRTNHQRLQYFQYRTGAIRYHLSKKQNGIDLSCHNEPTHEQWQRMRECFLENRPEKIYYDIYDRDGYRLDSGTFIDVRAFSGIKRKYREKCNID